MGTIQYMSPEQVEGKEADARSDIFAFGAMLYQNDSVSGFFHQPDNVIGSPYRGFRLPNSGQMATDN